jgi:hypothetical protein
MLARHAAVRSPKTNLNRKKAMLARHARHVREAVHFPKYNTKRSSAQLLKNYPSNMAQSMNGKLPLGFITHHVVPPRPGGERLGQDLVFEMSECARQPISPCGCSRLSRTIFRNCLSGGDEPAYLRFHQFKAIMLFIVLLYHPLAVILVTILRDITQSPPISSSFLKKLQPMLVA